MLLKPEIFYHGRLRFIEKMLTKFSEIIKLIESDCLWLW